MKVYGKSWIFLYSDEYKKYLKKNKINNYLIKFTQISILVLLLLLWEYLARNNIINSFISSSPSRVIKAIINLYKQNPGLFCVFRAAPFLVRISLPDRV